MASRASSLQESDELANLFEEMTVRDQQYDDHQWSWETFLKPLNLSRKYESNVHIVDPVDSCGSLGEKFVNRLNEQHEEIVQQKKEAVDKAREKLIEYIESLFPGLVPSNDDVFKRLKDLNRSFQHYENTLKMKSDVQSSGSTWTVEMLERYILRDDIEFVKSISCVRKDEAVSNQIVKNVSYILFDPIRRDLRTECDTRMVLDAILLPLCAHKQFTLQTEQTIKCRHNKLPTNRFDYIIGNCTGNVIGAVEAKRQGSLEGKSMAQLIVQLLLLSAKDPRLFYLGILSDGCQFIFVGLCEKKVCFFQRNQFKLEIATIKSEQDVETITKTILNFVDFTIKANERILKGTYTVECIPREISVLPMDQGLLVSQTPLQGTQSRASSLAASHYPQTLVSQAPWQEIQYYPPVLHITPQVVPQHSPIPYFFPLYPPYPS